MPVASNHVAQYNHALQRQSPLPSSVSCPKQASAAAAGPDSVTATLLRLCAVTGLPACCSPCSSLTRHSESPRRWTARMMLQPAGSRVLFWPLCRCNRRAGCSKRHPDSRSAGKARQGTTVWPQRRPASCCCSAGERQTALSLVLAAIRDAQLLPSGAPLRLQR